MSSEKSQHMLQRVGAACCLWLCFLLSLPAQAHRSYESHMFLDVTGPVTLRWEIETRNFETLFSLDDSGNEIVSWAELTAHMPELLNYAAGSISLRVNGEQQTLQLVQPELKRVDDETYLVVQLLGLPDTRIEQFDLSYSLFFDMDLQQRLLLKVRTPQGDALYRMGPGRQRLLLAPGYGSALERFADFLMLGGEHIISGYDHLVFLLMLVVSALLAQRLAAEWGSRRLAMQLLKLVTAFSVAHSITLMLTAADLIFLPPAWIELGIALTVLWASLGNLFVRPHALTWPLVFMFGLIHGFGFANALREMELVRYDFIAMMLGFNLGVELGQLLMVLAVLPLLLVLRRYSRAYVYVLRGLSALSVLAALYWVLERV